jgi:hypothetical protein
MTRKRPGCIRAALAAVMILLLAAPADSFVPRAERVVSAVTKSNKKGHRTSALRVEIALRIDDGDVVAKGELISHPTGLARLELRTPAGLVERHLMLGTEHRAARNGKILPSPRAFVPPIFFMQASSDAVLDAALDSFGVEAKLVGVAPCGRNDCYVLGDPERAIARPHREVASVVEFTRIEIPEDPDPVAEDAEDDEIEPDDSDREDLGPPAELAEGSIDGAEEGAQVIEIEEEISSVVIIENMFASVWFESEGFNLVKIRSSEGVEFEFGPVIAFSKRLRFPEWWTIAEPGKPVVRFEVSQVSSVTAPGGAFREEWMLAPAPVPAPAPDDDSAPGSGLGSGLDESPPE